jgi:hypothetical protein
MRRLVTLTFATAVILKVVTWRTPAEVTSNYFASKGIRQHQYSIWPLALEQIGILIEKSLTIS